MCRKTGVTLTLIAFASIAMVYPQAADADIGGDMLHWNDGTYDISVLPAVVTSDGNGTHITTPGVSAFGVNHDGVGDLLIETTGDASFDYRGTASLLTLGGRRWAIAAAHLVTDGAGNKIANHLQLEFETASGSMFSTVNSPSEMYVHPSWNGSATNGFDLALLRLDAVADPTVPDYLLNRTANELDVDVVHVGYGNKGYGSTGADTGTSGTKRAGLKEWDSQGLGSLGVGGITNNSTMLTDDFDSGSSANDAFNFFFGFSADLGFVNDEVGVSPGDSGGPSFIEDSGIWKIAGIHSHGLRLAFTSDGSSSDVDGTLNFSWGEFGVDARVLDPDVISWIDQIIPEPVTLVLLLAGSLASLKRRRKT